jgi:two-component system, LytTR family, sensor kinase
MTSVRAAAAADPAALPAGRVFRWTPRALLLLVAGATVLGMMEALQLYAGSVSAGRSITLARAVGATLPSWYVHALLVPPTWWVAARLPLDRQQAHRARSLALLVPIGVLYAITTIGMSAVLSDVVFAPAGMSVVFPEHLLRLVSVYFMVTTVYFWATIGAYYLLEYRRRGQEHRRAAAALALHTSQLETSLATASLAALRLQLNPHFLFNTLNTISVLSRKGENEEVTRMIGRLSDLLRMSLDNSRQIVTVADELAVLDAYLQIEQVRFGDRLTVKRTIGAGVLGAALPSMLLQPLVENALKHGIARKPGPGTVEVRVEREGDRLVIQVYDTGPGFSPPGRNAGNGTGVGLANTRKRLEQLYGAEQSLLAHSPAGGGAIVRISLPWDSSRAEQNGNRRKAQHDNPNTAR